MSAPTFAVGDGITYYGADHSPGVLWQSATWGISEAVLPYLRTVTDGPAAWDEDQTIAGAIEIRDGVVVNPQILSFQGRAPAWPHAIAGLTAVAVCPRHRWCAGPARPSDVDPRAGGGRDRVPSRSASFMPTNAARSGEVCTAEVGASGSSASRITSATSSGLCALAKTPAVRARYAAQRRGVGAGAGQERVAVAHRRAGERRGDGARLDDDDTHTRRGATGCRLSRKPSTANFAAQ